MREGGGEVYYKDYDTELGSHLDFISESEDLNLIFGSKDENDNSQIDMQSVSCPSYYGDESFNESAQNKIMKKELEKLINFNESPKNNKNNSTLKNSNKITTTTARTQNVLQSLLSKRTYLEEGETKSNLEQSKIDTLNSFKEKYI